MNMTIEWTHDLNTGIEVIDTQHKKIVDYINKLANAINQQDHPSVGQVLDELMEYTISHFSFEENLQQEAGYQLALPHKAVHDIFVKRVRKYQLRHAAGENVAEQLLSMLGTWLVHHIKRDDMAYVSAVSANITRLVKDKQEGSWISRSLGRFFK
jgi:hemerythrin